MPLLRLLCITQVRGLELPARDNDGLKVCFTFFFTTCSHQQSLDFVLCFIVFVSAGCVSATGCVAGVGDNWWTGWGDWGQRYFYLWFYLWPGPIWAVMHLYLQLSPEWLPGRFAILSHCCLYGWWVFFSFFCPCASCCGLSKVVICCSVPTHIL